MNTTEAIELWDNSKRAKILITIFWSLTALTIIGIILGFYELEILKDAEIGLFISESKADNFDLIYGTIGIIQTIVYILSIITFLNWFRRAYGNLHRLQIDNYIEHDVTMAVWCWFIPIICIFRPYQIMKEIWEKTQRAIKKYDSSYISNYSSFKISIWWGLYLLSNFVGRYVFKTMFNDETIEQLIESSQAILISDIVQIPEALLVILIVSQLSKMESKLAKEVTNAGGNIIIK